MNEKEKFELQVELNRCKELLDTGVLTSFSPFRGSVMTELLIKLNHILQRLSKEGMRITFNDDIEQTKHPKKMDITDLVNKMRAAACHIESPENYLGTQRFSFNTVEGKQVNAFSIGENNLGCEFEDDVAFFYGIDRIYLNRHINRVIKEIDNKIGDIKHP